MAAGFLLAAAALLNPVRAQAPAAKPPHSLHHIMGDDIGFMQPHITHSAIIWANWDKKGFSDEGDCDD